jgi:hypothetical protein
MTIIGAAFTAVAFAAMLYAARRRPAAEEAD